MDEVHKLSLEGYDPLFKFWYAVPHQDLKRLCVAVTSQDKFQEGMTDIFGKYPLTKEQAEYAQNFNVVYEEEMKGEEAKREMELFREPLELNGMRPIPK